MKIETLYDLLKDEYKVILLENNESNKYTREHALEALKDNNLWWDLRMHDVRNMLTLFDLAVSSVSMNDVLYGDRFLNKKK